MADETKAATGGADKADAGKAGASAATEATKPADPTDDLVERNHSITIGRRKLA